MYIEMAYFHKMFSNLEFNEIRMPNIQQDIPIFVLVKISGLPGVHFQVLFSKPYFHISYTCILALSCPLCYESPPRHEILF